MMTFGEAAKTLEEIDRLFPGLILAFKCKSNGLSDSEMVQTCARDTEGEFCAEDIARYVKERFGDDLSNNRVVVCLSRMVKRGGLTLVRKGAGKTPSLFSNLANSGV